MTNEEKQALRVINNSTDVEYLVAILELTALKTGADTVSEVARKENKSPNGIRKSNQYRKIKIGKQTMVVSELVNNNLPF